jgi:hypothetical protein
MKLVVIGFVALAPFIGATAAAQRSVLYGSVEDIYIVRSLCLSRTPPGDFCAERRTGFAAPTLEDRYDFNAMAEMSAPNQRARIGAGCS